MKNYNKKIKKITINKKAYFQKPTQTLKNLAKLLKMFL